MPLALLLVSRIFSPASADSTGKGWEGKHTLGNSESINSHYTPSPEESELVKRIQRGDSEAMRELVLSYAEKLTRFAYTFVQESDEAEEIAYDVLSNTWQQRERLQAERSLNSYLFTAVKFRALDRLAHEQVRKRSSVLLENEAEIHNKVLTPDDLLFAAEHEEAQVNQLIILRQAIATLSQRHQNALHLRFEQGLSYPEIGRILSISDKAAQQLVIRSIRTLQKLVGL